MAQSSYENYGPSITIYVIMEKRLINMSAYAYIFYLQSAVCDTEHYLSACCVIYAVKPLPPFCHLLQMLLFALLGRFYTFCSSPLLPCAVVCFLGVYFIKYIILYVSGLQKRT